MAERSPDVPSFTQACTRSAIRSSSELLLATLLPHRQQVEMTRWVCASLSWKNAWGWSSTVCSAFQPKVAKSQKLLVVLARYKYSFANVPIEQHLHLALRFILDALVRSKHRVASLAARKRDWCELDDLEFSFLHLRTIRRRYLLWTSAG